MRPADNDLTTSPVSLRCHVCLPVLPHVSFFGSIDDPPNNFCVLFLEDQGQGPSRHWSKKKKTPRNKKETPHYYSVCGFCLPRPVLPCDACLHTQPSIQVANRVNTSTSGKPIKPNKSSEQTPGVFCTIVFKKNRI